MFLIFVTFPSEGLAHGSEVSLLISTSQGCSVYWAGLASNLRVPERVTEPSVWFLEVGVAGAPGHLLGVLLVA